MKRMIIVFGLVMLLGVFVSAISTPSGEPKFGYKVKIITNNPLKSNLVVYFKDCTGTIVGIYQGNNLQNVYEVAVKQCDGKSIDGQTALITDYYRDEIEMAGE